MTAQIIPFPQRAAEPDHILLEGRKDGWHVEVIDTNGKVHADWEPACGVSDYFAAAERAHNIALSTGMPMRVSVRPEHPDYGAA